MKESAQKIKVCPRCGGAIPNDKNPGESCGALSLYGPYEICSPCGDDETHEAQSGKPGYMPANWKHWPTGKPEATLL